MPNPKIRLYVPAPYAKGQHVPLGENQSHYLSQVMRLGAGDMVAVFNGQDGEWLANVAELRKKQVTLQITEKRAEQTATPDVWLAFAPIKAKSELVVEKATELGVAKIIAVITKHGVVKSINHEKLTAHAIEAAEQCERMDVPSIETAKDLPTLLASWPKERLLLHADESGQGAPLSELLKTLPQGAYGMLVGPEGGFSSDEQRMLKAASFVRGFGMGPRILRADTATVAALACLMAAVGDWEKQPHFMAKETHD